jgi:hypothetical protein
MARMDVPRDCSCGRLQSILHRPDVQSLAIRATAEAAMPHAAFAGPVGFAVVQAGHPVAPPPERRPKPYAVERQPYREGRVADQLMSG